MINRAYCLMMTSYNQWMNQKLYALCAEFSDAERTHNRGAFFGSIHGTLNHLLYGDRIWLGRFTGQPLTGLHLGQDLYHDFSQLWQERCLTDQALGEWADQVSEEWLALPFEYSRQVDGKIRVLPAWVLVTHLFNHQTHHRGQLTTLISQLGKDPGVTDLPWLPQLDVYGR